MSRTLVLGAGITGLATAGFLKEHCAILERDSEPGGLCRSVGIGGFTFDYSGHFLHLRTPFAKKFVKSLLSSNISKIRRNSAIYTHSVYVPYPFQINLANLPEKVKKECLAKFLQKPDYRGKYGDFLHWSNETFGEGITKHFMRPYNEKLWTVSSKTLTSEWVKHFVPVPSESDVIKGARKNTKEDIGYNAYFSYPKRGGIGAFAGALAENVGQDIVYNTASEQIDLRRGRVSTSSGKKYFYDTLVSTIPMPELIAQIKDVPAEVKRAAAVLRWNRVRVFNIGVRKARAAGRTAAGFQWVYYPEKKYRFYRVGVYSNIERNMAPEGCYSLYVEVSENAKGGDRTELADVIGGLKDAGILNSKDKIELVNILKIPCAYVIYDANVSHARKVINGFLARNRVFSIGRYGAWEYSFIEKNILDAKNAAERLNCGK
ncbi:MAG: FAD-dependent oxidoreductase [Endomicrobiales bacterium]|nr:FAD-dependent oxidoreductase [Endomicrobiales bacterium]